MQSIASSTQMTFPTGETPRSREYQCQAQPVYNSRPTTQSNMPRTQPQICENLIDFELTAPCPCLDPTLGSCENRKTVNTSRKPIQTYSDTTTPMLTVDNDKVDEDAADDDSDFDNDLLPGTLVNGREYEPISVLAEGWVHIKGTGKDWFGSRSWKARYAKLVLAEVEDFENDIPLLLIYWYPTSEIPSTVISLDSTVVIQIDKDDPCLWNAYQWKVTHLHDEHQCTRTFTAPQHGRDTWVSEINKAMAL